MVVYFVAVVVAWCLAAYKVAWQSQFHGHFLALLRQDTSLSLSLQLEITNTKLYSRNTNYHFTNTKIQFLAQLCKNTSFSLQLAVVGYRNIRI